MCPTNSACIFVLLLSYYSIRVKFGATTRTQKDGFVEIDAEKLIKHEKFVPVPMLENDVGLIKLKAGISSFGEFINESLIK